MPRESGEPRGGYAEPIPGTQSTVPARRARPRHAEHCPGTQSPSRAHRAPSRHTEPVLGTQSTVLACRARPGHAEPFLGTQSTVPACRARPGHAEHRPGPCQALCLSAEGRRLHGSDRGHSSRRQCPEARGVHTARETPRGVALVLGRGRGVQKAMRRLWGCRRGPPSVGLLGGQALTLSGVCSLPHAALSLREMHPLPTGAQAETRDAPPPPGSPQTAAGIHPHCTWPPGPFCCSWWFTLRLPACPPTNPTQGGPPSRPLSPPS